MAAYIYFFVYKFPILKIKGIYNYSLSNIIWGEKNLCMKCP